MEIEEHVHFFHNKKEQKLEFCVFFLPTMFFKDRCLLLRKETGTTVDLGCLKPKAPWRFLNGMGFQDLGGVGDDRPFVRF